MRTYIPIFLLCLFVSCDQSNDGNGQHSINSQHQDSCLERILKLKEVPLISEKDFWSRLERPFEKCLEGQADVMYMKKLSKENLRFLRQMIREGN